jgi:chitinase
MKIHHCAPALLLLAFCATTLPAQKPQVIGYISGHGRLMQASEISPRKLTRIHYAFLFPVDGEVNDNIPTDAANLTTLVSLKQVAPVLQVIVSIGGASHSGVFSDIALTSESRARFAQSCLRLIEKYGLDGVDIDWEYPAAPRPDGHFRPEDKHNYTLLLRDLRQTFDAAESRLGRHLITSTATNGKAFFLRNTEMSEVSRYVDTINLMGYDFYGDGSKTTGNHSALFTDPSDPNPISDDQCIHAYIAAGVPPEKITLGVPFYGHGWAGVSLFNHGLFQPDSSNSGFEILYNEIVSKDLKANSGFVRYWDSISAVPWLYNEKSGILITYDDPESLTLKAEYVTNHHLGGIMFWSESGDSGDALLDAINTGLGRKP